MGNWNEPDDNTLRNLKYSEEHQEPRRRRPATPIIKEEVEKRIKSIPPPPELTVEETKIEKLETKVAELERKNRGLYAQVENLKAGLGTKFLTGRRRIVTYHYGKEIAAYLNIKYASVQRAKQDNKGAAYPFLYRTNAPLLAEQLAVTVEAATKVIKFLNDTGAWRLMKTEPGKIYTYQLGERKRVSYTTNGKRAIGYVNKFLFTLYPNSKSLNFYKKEIERLIGIQENRKEKKQELEEQKAKIKKLKSEVDKKIKKFFENTPSNEKQEDGKWEGVQEGWELNAESCVEDGGRDNAEKIECLMEIIETIKEQNKIRFNPYTGTRRSFKDRKQQIEKNVKKEKAKKQYLENPSI